MGLIRSLFWFMVFVMFTFAFTVIFEHGVGNFSNDARQEFELFKRIYASKPGPKSDKSDELLR